MPDLFISHASEDKATVARPLCEALTAEGVSVWLDEAELTLGDSIRQKIEEGLRAARFGVVVLSQSFFRHDKYWTQQELDALFARESAGTKVILPVWHGLTAEDVRQIAPLLAGRIAARWEDGLESVVAAILRVVKPEARPVRAVAAPVDELPTSNVLLRDAKGNLAFLAAGRINEAASTIQIELTPRDGEERAYLRGLRSARSDQHVAFHDAATRARLLEVTSETSGGLERFVIILERETTHGSSMEASYNGVTADELAEMRAKLILLGGEAPAGRSDRSADWMLETMIRGPLETVPNLIAVAKEGAPSPDEQVARLRLLATLELVLSDIVEHVVLLDVSLAAGRVHWRFVGRRRRRYDTEEPATIRVEGSRSF